MSKSPVTAYVTKWALTAGIIKVKGTLHEDTVSPMLSFVRGGPWKFTEYVHGNDFWLTEADALADAESRRAKKVASHKKGIAKLEKFEFKIVDAN